MPMRTGKDSRANTLLPEATSPQWWHWSPVWPGKFSDSDPSSMDGEVQAAVWVKSCSCGYRQLLTLQKPLFHPLTREGSRHSWASKLLRKVVRNTAEEWSATLPQEPSTKTWNKGIVTRRKTKDEEKDLAVIWKTFVKKPKLPWEQLRQSHLGPLPLSSVWDSEQSGCSDIHARLSWVTTLHWCSDLSMLQATQNKLKSDLMLAETWRMVTGSYSVVRAEFDQIE